MSKSFYLKQSTLRGRVKIPASKSHTIRAVAIGALGEGETRISDPLVSEDTLAAVRIYQTLGAQIEMKPNVWVIQGTKGQLRAPDKILDVGNSGTTLRIALGSCALLKEGKAVLTGDEQIRRRPAGPLVKSLNDLGAKVSSRNDTGLPPFSVSGRLRGGTTSIEAQTSQYVTSLLLNVPLGDGDTEIQVPLLNEGSYVQMTLDWLKRQGIEVENETMQLFRIPGNQSYQPFVGKVPGDFSSATFFLAAGALGDNEVTCSGLDMGDSQSDKAVVDYLKQMGAKVKIEGDSIQVQSNKLVGIDIDMNDTPDALPMMAVVGCFAKGKTRLLNVPQARIKETDRIAAMAKELKKMGAKIRELPDGLEIEESKLRAAKLQGYSDHRVVMALAIAGLACKGETVVNSAEAVAITFPNFAEYLTSLGANINISND